MFSTATASTTTITTTTKPAKVARTSSSILLTPAEAPKRRKLELVAQPASHATEGGPAAPSSALLESSPAEIWRWTLTRDARALCFVKDVLEMRDSENRDMEYFWLGRIPCRSVELVGELVGIQVYEQRIVYTYLNWDVAISPPGLYRLYFYHLFTLYSTHPIDGTTTRYHVL
ncbi:hypothetical protein C8Q72DRAFT_94224 [Fomitopsis betulina]|nr:hypothetical protein C8Q72DRAFT_94224 [Fomitopsis betulina]